MVLHYKVHPVNQLQYSGAEDGDAGYLCSRLQPNAIHVSDPLQSLLSDHAVIQVHIVHTSGGQISLCEGQNPKA